jgi:hypothetical protein
VIVLAVVAGASALFLGAFALALAVAFVVEAVT